ncbi:ATP-dependent DNA helicase tlh1 [Mycena sanguinolenta]|uniref:DNA 3'-5' helicase n=1 Tax=Mycena sanguinolenta TaxID=230812 RepID=A0A8H6Z0J0_9AGAR|nr:ATP-dependent DNA helicase tlh1 [Mycena sanguinolenta]
MEIDAENSAGVEPKSLAGFTRVDGHEDLITDALLDTVGLAYQVEWNLFLCCKTLFHSAGIFVHFHKDHTIQQRPSAKVKEHILHLAKQWDMPDSYVDTKPTVAPRIAASGVDIVENLYGCAHCAVTGSKKYLQAHNRGKPHPSLPQKPFLEGLSAHYINRNHCRVIRRPKPAIAAAPSLMEQMASLDSEVVAQGPGITNGRLISPFLHRTKWHEIREPYKEHVPKLIALAAFPSNDEFRILVEAVRLYFRNADELFDHTEELVLQHLNTHDPAKSGINNTPFHRHQNGDTTAQQYVVVIIRLIASLLRCSEVFSMELDEDLAAAINDLRLVLCDHRHGASDAQSTLHAVFTALWHTRWRQTSASRMPDPTMRFLMLMSCQTGGEFATAKDTSGPIRKLCWGIQMHGLAEIHRLVETEGIFQMEAYERIAEFLVEKDITTYAALWSLQHYTSAVSMQTVVFPKIWWLDTENWTELLYRGQRVSIEQLEDIFTRLEAEIVDLWEISVLMGMDLHVGWSDIVEDLTEKRAGYSFLTDKRNPFHKHKHSFAKALDENLDLRKRFTTSGSGYTQLDLMKCRDWLYKLAKLEGLVMLLTDMLGGAPPRGTELVSMLACNTPFRLRNFCVLGRHIAIVRQYDKTSNITQSDRLIPHSISAVVADITIQIHTFARPWAQFLASKIWVNDPSVSTAYREMLYMDMGHMFTSDRLGQLMGSKTSGVLGWEVKISIYRQINIAFRRKKCGGAIELIEQETVSTLNAMSSGHSLRTENMVYGLSPDSLAGAPEDVLPLFLFGSGEWQTLHRMVPGGLGLHYRAARCHKFAALVSDGTIKLKRKRREGEGSSVPVEVAEKQDQMLALMKEMQQAINQNAHSLSQIEAKQDRTLAVLAQIEARIQALETAPPTARIQALETAPPAGCATATTATPKRKAVSPEIIVIDTPSPKRESTAVPRSIIRESTAVPRGTIARTLFSGQPSQSQSQVIQRRKRPQVSSSPTGTPHRPRKQFVSSLGSTPVKEASPRSNTVKELALDSGQINVLEKLRELLKDPNAGWKNEAQYLGIRECLALQRDMVVTSKTGDGKTLIAVVPALVEDAITIVVVPLLSLLEDWERRLNAFGVPYERFQGAANPKIIGDANIVLVSCDMIKRKSWSIAVADVTKRRTIARMVFDEGYYYGKDHEFRKETFSQAYHIRGFNCQIVLMGATVSKAAFRFLKKEFELEKPLRITSGFYRPELNLTVIRDCKTAKDCIKKIKAIIDHHTRSPDWKPTDRWVVFVVTITEGEELARELGVPLYRAAKGEDRDQENADRKQLYEDWADGTYIGLVATSALSAGNDLAHIRLTIHKKCPHTATDYGQEAGRAERDGKEAYNYIVAQEKPWTNPNPPHPEFGDMHGMQVISDLVYKTPATFPERCMIYQLTKFFDGKGFTCNDYKREQPCTGCYGQTYEGNPVAAAEFDKNKALWITDEDYKLKKRKLDQSFGAATNRAVLRKGKDLSSIQDGLDLYRRIFALVGQTCGICHCFGTQPATEHEFNKCPIFRLRPELKKQFDQFRHTISYPRGENGPCYTCHIVSGGRDSLHPPFEMGRAQAKCPNPKLALTIAFGIWAEPEWREKALEYFQPEGLAWDSIAGFTQWYSMQDNQKVWRSMAMIRFFGQNKLKE